LTYLLLNDLTYLLLNDLTYLLLNDLTYLLLNDWTALPRMRKFLHPLQQTMYLCAARCVLAY
jgi:hypothetical protein